MRRLSWWRRMTSLWFSYRHRLVIAPHKAASWSAPFSVLNVGTPALHWPTLAQRSLGDTIAGLNLRALYLVLWWIHILLVPPPSVLSLCSCVFPSLISESKGINLSHRLSGGQICFSPNFHSACSLKVKCAVREAFVSKLRAFFSPQM